MRGLPLAERTETTVHEQAGRLLRRWHDLAEPIGDQARTTITASIAEQAHEAAQWLRDDADHLTDAQRTLVYRVVHELPSLAANLPVVYRHGDFAPRNWLWSAEHGTVGMIDFEQTDHGLAVEDLVWLHGAA